MTASDVFPALEKIGINIDPDYWTALDDNAVCTMQKVSWHYLNFDGLRIGFVVSDRQIPYLSEVSFVKLFDNEEDAKNFLYSSKIREKNKYSRYVLSEENDKKEFFLYDPDDGMSRVHGRLNKNDSNAYSIIIAYNGYINAYYVAEKDSM